MKTCLFVAILFFMEFKQEAFEYKMKFQDKWVNKNVGLLSKAR